MSRLIRLSLSLLVALTLPACQSGGTDPVATLPDSSFQLDTSFNAAGTTPGVLTTTLSVGSDTALGMVIQSDGKIVTAGSTFNGVNNDIVLVRYINDGINDGALDSGFGTGGVVTTNINSANQGAYAVALQGTGEIVVAGYSSNTTTALNNFVVARYTAAGALDTTFNAAGNAYDSTGTATAGINPAGVVTVAAGTGHSVARALVIQTDGKIVVAGSAKNIANDDIAVARFNTDGTIDGGFGTGGIATVEVTTTYSGGTAVNDIANAVRQQSGDNKIVVAGTSNGVAVVVRLNTNGSLDGGYGTNGITLLSNMNQGNALILLADNRALLGGAAVGSDNSNDMAVARLTTSGALDPSFGTAGIAMVGFLSGRGETVTSLALQTDNKIVAGGGAASGIGYDFSLVRLHSNGTLDTSTDVDPSVTFGLEGRVSTPIGFSTDTINAIAIQTDGRIVAAGGSWMNSRWIMALTRYYPYTPWP